MGWAVALHGGAGDIARTVHTERMQRAEQGLRHCLQVAVSALKKGGSALDVAELVVCELENNPTFNAGKGSVLTTAGTVEMEACIMDGLTKRCGAVSGLSTVVHPISAARLIMERTPHIYLAFDAAEKFARDNGLETADEKYFITEENVQRLARARQTNVVQVDYNTPTQNECQQETVGCVVYDSKGNLAAATSTGGLINKMVGRIGDTPIVGAGNYANNLCAVSTTGRGEYIIRATAARDVVALMEYKGLTLKEACEYVVNHMEEGTCGVVAVSRSGEVAMAFNTSGMFRACATEDGYSEVAMLA